MPSWFLALCLLQMRGLSAVAALVRGEKSHLRQVWFGSASFYSRIIQC